MTAPTDRHAALVAEIKRRIERLPTHNYVRVVDEESISAHRALLEVVEMHGPLALALLEVVEMHGPLAFSDQAQCQHCWETLGAVCGNGSWPCPTFSRIWKWIMEEPRAHPLAGWSCVT